MAEKKSGRGSAKSKGASSARDGGSSRSRPSAAKRAPSSAKQTGAGGKGSNASSSRGKPTGRPAASSGGTRQSSSQSNPARKRGSAAEKAIRTAADQAGTNAKRARSRAERYKNDAKATDELLRDAQEKAKKQKGPLGESFDDIMTLIRMVQAYFKGAYKDVPWESIALAIGALVYFLLPIDAIPDPIPVVGYIDDAAVVGFVLASIHADIGNFREWESTQAKMK